MREKSQLPEIDAELSEILEKSGAFLCQTVARICPKNLGIHFDDIEQEARLRRWRAIEAEKEINSVTLCGCFFERRYCFTVEVRRFAAGPRTGGPCEARQTSDQL